MTTLYEADPFAFNESSGILDQPSSSPPSGVGLAAPSAQAAPVAQAAPTQPVREQDPFRAEYAKMSGPQEFFTRVGEFGNGVLGRPSPLGMQIEARRRDKLAKIAEVKETTSALEHGVKLAQGMEGDARTKFIESYAGTLDGLDQGLGNTFKAVADRPDVVANIQKYLPYLPAPMQYLAKADTAAFIKTLGTAEGIKAVDAAKNQFFLQTASQKARTLMMGADHLGVPPELIAELQKTPTASTFLRLEQAATDSRVKFSPDEIAAINAHPDIFYPSLKLMSPKGEEAVAEDKAKKGTKSAHEVATEGENAQHHRALEGDAAARRNLEQQRLDQDKWGPLTEVSIDGKNVMVTQDKKNNRIIDANGNDVTAKIAPQVKGSPLDPGRVSMALQAHKDINDARNMIFDANGELNRTVIASMDVPGTKGVGTDARKAYSSIENAVSAKYRMETGAAGNQGEVESIAARFRPNLMDTKESAKYKMDRLQEFMGMTLDQLKESYHISQATYDKAKGGSRGDRGGEAQPLPADQSALVPNQDYVTSRGVATWNGTEFVPKKKKK